MIFAGVDPGKTGAIGAVSGLDKPEFVGVWDCPLTPAGKVDGKQVAEIITVIQQVGGGNIELAMIEQLQAFSRGRDKSGRPIRLKGFDKLTENCGSWQAMFSVFGIETASVAPSTWKASTLGRGTKGDKRVSLQHARLLFPAAELHLLKHHGRAEALLLSDYARRLYRGQVLMGTRKQPAQQQP